uniref:ABC transmembrane type-1 domain-containing protein n=1 Tax=Rhabditophanes sp. KR3021 TaxID=114890 RepID=A0AC35TYI8_9BILA
MHFNYFFKLSLSRKRPSIIPTNILIILSSLTVLHQIESITFTCPQNQILIASYIGKYTVKMYCDQVNVCLGLYNQKKIRCKYYNGESSCGGKTNFISAIQSGNTNLIKHECCQNRNPGFAAHKCFVKEIPDTVDTSSSIEYYETFKNRHFTESEEQNLFDKFNQMGDSSNPYQLLEIPFKRKRITRLPVHAIKSIQKNEQMRLTKKGQKEGERKPLLTKETFEIDESSCYDAVAIIQGAGFPLLSVVMGSMTNIFLKAENSYWVTNSINNGTDTISPAEFDKSVTTYCLYYVGLGTLVLATGYLQISMWEGFSERLVNQLRHRYLAAVLRQSIEWFDDQNTGSLTTRLTDDLGRLREGSGDKVSLLIQNISAFICGISIGLYYDFKLSLIMLVFTPFIALTGAWMGKMLASRTKLEQDVYAKAGAISEEVFSNIRTVQAMNGGARELKRYDHALEEARLAGHIKYFYLGIGVSLAQICMYCSYAVAFYFACQRLIEEPFTDKGAVIIVMMSVMSGSTALGVALPYFNHLSVAKGAASKAITVLNSKPHIDPYSEEGVKLHEVRGDILIKNVHFRYPSRKDVPILKGVSISIKAGERIGFCGTSGCGKSTLINLLLRFYDPESGEILLDGHNLKQLNVNALREHVSIVSQDPVLFDGSIMSNILLGAGKDQVVTRAEVLQACKQANALDFIEKLPQHLETRCGERGFSLSLGQVSRICLARALIRQPKIIILDEATASLALDKASIGRTTIAIAHRLSTIKDYDNIYVFKNGNIIQSGTHNELIRNTEGDYYQMVMAQKINAQKESVIAERHIDDEETSTTVSRKHKASTVVSKATTTSTYTSDKSALSISSYSDEIEEANIKPVTIGKIFKFNANNWGSFFFGSFCSCVNGLVTPLFAVVYSQMFTVFSESPEQLGPDSLFWASMFIICGLVYGFAFVGSCIGLGRSGEGLTKKLRFETFKNLLRQDISFYDNKRHNTGKLSTRFSTEVPNIRFVFTRLPLLFSALVTFVASLSVAIYMGWQLALILTIVIPLMISAGYFEMQMRMGKQLRDTKQLEEAGKIASEAVENVKTVQGLNKQREFHAQYCAKLEQPYKNNMKVGQISSFIPDIVKARLAGALIFHLIEYPTKIDSLSDEGFTATLKGNIKISKVHFNYPTRKNVKVLDGLSLDIKQGSKVAIVGFSGQGKSTIMQLIERFYSFKRGIIKIDGYAIQDINIKCLREAVAYVEQQPFLFNCSIRDNLIYGSEHKNISHQQIVEAAKQSNIYDFILTLPLGFDTIVLEKGGNLSGGQKSRLALCRNLLRGGCILLLDECTAALDVSVSA